MHILDAISFTVPLSLSVTTYDGSQPTLSQVKSMDWSEIKQYCHQYIDSVELLRTIAFKQNESDEYYRMLGNVKNVNYAGSYSEDPFVSYYLVKADHVSAE